MPSPYIVKLLDESIKNISLEFWKQSLSILKIISDFCFFVFLVWLCFLLFVFVYQDRASLSAVWQSWNLFCTPDWTASYWEPPASVYHVLALKACVTTVEFQIFFYYNHTTVLWKVMVTRLILLIFLQMSTLPYSNY